MSNQQLWWEVVRRRMPVTRSWAFFDHAAVAPLSGPALQVFNDWAHEFSENGGAHWSSWRTKLEETRTLAATLIGASPDEIALVHNTTHGIELVAEGFPWHDGDNVVTLDSEFPSNLYPWMNLASRGVETRKVVTDRERCTLDAVASACDQRTRIIAVSWVGYMTGWRNDLAALAELAHASGALLFVDAIQALGVLPVDVRETPIDFLAADGHKWMLGPEGAGLFYVRSAHLDLLHPLGVGWNSVRQAGDFNNTSFDLKPTAGRYEGGSYNLGGHAALGASLKLLLDVDSSERTDRLFDVTQQLCERLKEIGAEIASSREPDRWSGIVAFELPGKDAIAVRRQCFRRNVLVNCRAGRLRASPHVYTNEDDIARLIAALKAI